MVYLIIAHNKNVRAELRQGRIGLSHAMKLSTVSR